MQATVARKHIQRGVLLRLCVLAAIAALVCTAAIYEIYKESISLRLAAGAYAAGIVLGIIASRMVKTEWDTKHQQVITRFDAFGIVLLILYIAFALARNKLLGQWLHGALLTASTVSLLAGILSGRIIGQWLAAKHLLTVHGKLPKR